MTFKLEIIPSARKKWDELESSIKEQFKKKLRERLISPLIPSAALHGMKDHYKIKLRQLGYRLLAKVLHLILEASILSAMRKKSAT